MALGEVEVQGGVGRRGGTGRTKEGSNDIIFVLIGVRGRGGGTPLRLDWMWPPWDSVLSSTSVCFNLPDRINMNSI